MSLKDAKVTKEGIFLETLQKKVLIVPVRLTFTKPSPKSSRTPFFNNQTISKLFSANLSRYTIIFEKERKRSRRIIFLPYFSNSSLSQLSSNSKHFLNNFARLLKELDLELLPIEAMNFFQNLQKKFPKTITEISSGIFKIQGNEKSFYISTMQMPFTNTEEKKNLSFYIQDFFAMITYGRVIIDVKHSSSDKSNTPISQAAVRITLEAPSLAIIKQDLKRVLSLIKIFINKPLNQLKEPFLLLDQNLLQENYGKIILDQGWDFEVATCDELLKFIDLFQLVIPKKE
ncbi:MAG: hypothetical protein GF308_13790 [Candidatus Heimdallarchaeota archaeon]|nr:hypothetical protein [Candidatus Heimdallarchaeota archaeon]